MPPLLFTDIFVNNKMISPIDCKSPLKKEFDVYGCSEFALFTRTLSVISFARLDYSGADTDQIFYILEGFDKTWISAEDNRTIIYSNLKSGNYKLILGISGEDRGESIEKVKTLSIQIRPPFWRTQQAFLYIFVSFNCYIYTYTLFNRTR